MPQVGSTPSLGALRTAKGIWLEDTQGNKFIDLHGNTCHHIGHGHPRLVSAIKQQIDTLGFAPRRFTNESSVLLGEKLTRRFWDGDSRLLLATGGSDAIEIALRLSRATTRRSGIIAINGSYHGHGFASLALSSAVLDQRLVASCRTFTMSRLIGTKRQGAQTRCWPILKKYSQQPLTPLHALLRNPCDPTASRRPLIFGQKSPGSASALGQS